MGDCDTRAGKAPCESCIWRDKDSKNKHKVRAKQNDSENKGLPSKTFVSIYSWKPIKQPFCKHGLRLNSNFYGFKRTQGHICEYLSRSTTEKIYGSSVIVRQDIAVERLELPVESESASALDTIA